MKRALLPLVLVCLLASSCRTTASEAEHTPAQVLSTWMSGSFTSAAQARDQQDLFFELQLHVTPIWTERADGPWLYVEQASATSLSRPYRQRIYRLVDVEAGVRSDAFTLPGEPLDLAGAWEDPERFAHLIPNDLQERSGCSIHLTRRGNQFVGGTRGQGCSSHLAGASFATSEVSIRRSVLEFWDRGFDENGEQVWGATHGAYEFVRVD